MAKIKIHKELKPRVVKVNYHSDKDMYTPDWDSTGSMDQAMNRVKDRNSSIRRVPVGSNGLSKKSAKNVESVNDRDDKNLFENLSFNKKGK